MTSAYLFPAMNLSREEAACVEFYIAMDSEKFLGNSVSSFSAMLILERQKQGGWSASYNGGNIPMSAAVPLYKLPWVFTYNSWSAKYDYMLKAAVRSGLAFDSFVPYCLFSGNMTSPIVSWLQVSTAFRHMMRHLVSMSSHHSMDDPQQTACKHAFTSPDRSGSMESSPTPHPQRTEKF